MTIALELESHASDELTHALTIARQLDCLGGSPTPEPNALRVSTAAPAILEYDLENESETTRNHRTRVQQCEALGEYAVAEEIRKILRNEQAHQIPRHRTRARRPEPDSRQSRLPQEGCALRSRDGARRGS